MQSIQERILEYVNTKGITPYKFCKDLGLSMGYLDKRGAIDTDKYLKIIEYYKDINPTWLLSGSGTMLRKQSVPYGEIEDDSPRMAAEYVRTKPEAATIPDIPEQNISMYRLKTDYFGQEKQFIPLYEIAASAGLYSVFDSQIQQVPLDYISVPNAPKCDGALYVRGDSMYLS
jgi:phage repressor protein C with HTH and peptisase S24 domain